MTVGRRTEKLKTEKLKSGKRKTERVAEREARRGRGRRSAITALAGQGDAPTGGTGGRESPMIWMWRIRVAR